MNTINFPLQRCQTFDGLGHKSEGILRNFVIIHHNLSAIRMENPFTHQRDAAEGPESPEAPQLVAPFHPPPQLLGTESEDIAFDSIARRHTLETSNMAAVVTQQARQPSAPHLGHSPSSERAYKAEQRSPHKDESKPPGTLDLRAHALEFVNARLNPSASHDRRSSGQVCDQYLFKILLYH